MMQTLLDRLQQFADYKEITITAIERVIGSSKGVLSRAIANKTDVQSKWICRLVENYPDLNSDWLLSGNGNMLKPCGLMSDEEVLAQEQELRDGRAMEHTYTPRLLTEGTCEECHLKNLRLKAQEEYIAEQKERIAELKETISVQRLLITDLQNKR